MSFVEVPIGTGGVTRCVRCGPERDERPHEAFEVAARIERVVREWEPAPGPNVVFTGMEPFAHPQLPLLVTAALEQGVRRLRLRTDAGALAQPGNAAGALGAGVRQVEVVIAGADAALHDRLMDRPGLFDAARTGVREWRSAAREAQVRVATCVRVPVCAHNIAHAPAIVAAVCGWGIDVVHIDATHLQSASPEVLRAALDTATMNAVAAFVTGADASDAGVYTIAPWREVPSP